MSARLIIDTFSIWIIPLIIICILIFGLVKKVAVYEVFTEGAKDGLKVAVDIVPYLLAIMVAIAMLRASGAIEIAQQIFNGILSRFDVPADVLPVMIVRSLSGSAVLGILSDISNNLGADSYPAKLAAVMAGSSETTFYVLSVYFGAVGIKKFRHAMLAGVLADVTGIIAAIAISRWLFL